jgi:hypothetical protein
MSLSTFAYSLTQKLGSSKEEEDLPTEKIVPFLSERQRALAISNGFTIIYFNYTSRNEVKAYLEELVKTYRIYLIENLADENSLKVESLKGSREIKNPTLNQTINLLCQIMIERPLECIMREIE